MELACRLEDKLHVEQRKSITNTILFWRCQFELAIEQEHLYRVNNFGHPACPMHGDWHLNCTTTRPGTPLRNKSRSFKKSSIVISGFFKFYMFLGKFQDVRIKLVHQGFYCFPCCPEVVKINELSLVFKSLEKKTFGACRSSDRCLLECSSDYWLNHAGSKIAQAPA